MEFLQTFSKKYSNLICKIITLNHLRRIVYGYRQTISVPQRGTGTAGSGE